MGSFVTWEQLKDAVHANPNRNASIGGLASTSVASLPELSTELSWLPNWSEDTTIRLADAVSLSLWIHEPIYRSAITPVRKAMEMEEAAWLLHSIEST